MNLKYPQNLKEGLLFGVVNAFFMVLGMMSFNLYLNDSFSFSVLLHGIIPVSFVAFCISFLFVTRITNFIINKYKIYKFTPFLMVFFMAGIMTFLAPLMELGKVMPLSVYLISFLRNYFAALCLQTLLVMPFALFVLSKYRTINFSK